MVRKDLWTLSLHQYFKCGRLSLIFFVPFPAVIPTNEATSEFGISSQFNPSKLFIDMLAAVGLVWGRKRGTAAWDMGRARRERDRKAGVPLPKPVSRPWEATAVKGGIEIVHWKPTAGVKRVRKV
jgi:hypothetical protein